MANSSGALPFGRAFLRREKENSRMKIPYFAASVGAALALAAAGCEVATHMGPAPPISLPTVQGGTFTLAEHRGKGPVIISFFSTT